jgi:hypothetical protein
LNEAIRDTMAALSREPLAFSDVDAQSVAGGQIELVPGDALPGFHRSSQHRLVDRL